MKALAIALVLVACGKSKADKQVEDYKAKSKSTEADIILNMLGKKAKMMVGEAGEFPKGKTSTLPAGPCCSQPNGKCAVTTDWDKDPVWKALDFRVDEPNLYSYHYESDGQTFTATAVGDADCDGQPATFTLTGKIDNGNPVVTLTKPPAGQY